jgi:hypothetical protein
MEPLGSLEQVGKRGFHRPAAVDGETDALAWLDARI